MVKQKAKCKTIIIEAVIYWSSNDPIIIEINIVRVFDYRLMKRNDSLMAFMLSIRTSRPNQHFSDKPMFHISYRCVVLMSASTAECAADVSRLTISLDWN